MRRRWVVTALASCTLAGTLGGIANAQSPSAQAPNLAGTWEDAKGQKVEITQTADNIEVHFKHDFFNSKTADQSDWVFKGTVRPDGFDIQHVPNLGNDDPTIPACAEKAPEKYPLRLVGKIAPNSNTIQATLNGEAIAYDGCKLVKQEPRSLSFELVCKIDEKVAGWRFRGDCPIDLSEGVKNLTVTPPEALGGTDIKIPGGDLLGYALPLKDRSHLFVPVVLPDLSISVGSTTITAYENTLGSDGITIGTAVLDLPKYHTSALVQDLTVDTGLHVTASLLQLDFDNASISADGVDFSPQTGLSAQKVTIGLPNVLGGGTVGISGFGIDSGGIRGTIDSASFSLGDIQVAFSGAKFTDTGFSLDSVQLNLPKYLGGAVFQASGVKYQAATNDISVEKAGGSLHFAIGNRLIVDANVKLEFTPDGGWAMDGSGDIDVPDVFHVHAELTLQSVKCEPYPSVDCPRPVFIVKAALGVHGKPVPLGQTGIAVTGFDASVQTMKDNPHRDANGDVVGITYYVSGDISLQTAADSGTLFKGALGATISTNGNFGLHLKDGTILRVIQLKGGLCGRFVAVADNVCDNVLDPSVGPAPGGTGLFAGMSIGPTLNYEGWLGKVEANLTASVAGWFADGNFGANVTGTMSAHAHSWLLPDLDGSAKLSATVGRFSQPGGPPVAGSRERSTAP